MSIMQINGYDTCIWLEFQFESVIAKQGDVCIGHNEILYDNLLLSFGKPSVLKESRSWFMIKDPFVHALRR